MSNHRLQIVSALGALLPHLLAKLQVPAGRLLLILLPGLLLAPRAALARGDGTFLLPLEFPGFTGPVWAAAADLNGDGSTDLAVVNGSSEIKILLQDLSDRTRWTAAPQVFAGNGPFFITATDLDGDEALDLAIADPGSSTHILWSRGDGTFEKATALPETSSSRGDVNGDGPVNISDAVSLLSWLFLGGKPAPCHDAADANHDGKHDLSDGVAILNYLFLGGAPPPAPGPTDCGPAPDPSLGCESYRC